MMISVPKRQWKIVKRRDTFNSASRNLPDQVKEYEEQYGLSDDDIIKILYDL